MKILTIGYILTVIYYTVSISYLYCCLLTPKEQIRHPFCTSVLLTLPNFCFLFLCPAYFKTTTVISFFLPLVLFKDSISRRITAYVISYLIPLISEMIATVLFMIIFYIYTGELQTSQPNAQSEHWQIFTTVFLIIGIGILIIPTVAPLLKTWFRNFRPGTLALLGLPLIVETSLNNMMNIADSSPYFHIYLALAAIIYLGCYIPVSAGFRDMHRQELVRNKYENQQLLMQKQLSYSQQLEKEYKELRKWNHDISNHFLALSYLLDNKQYEESIEYLNSLLETDDIPQLNTIPK